MAKRSPARRSRSATSPSVASARTLTDPLQHRAVFQPAVTMSERRTLVEEYRKAGKVRLVLNNAFAFGGLNSALALRAWEA